MKNNSNISRIELVDSIRGIALLGVLLANIPIAPNLISGTLDETFLFLSNFLIAKKFIAIFSMLFGFGFYIQYSNHKTKGKQFSNYFIIRMVVLMIIATVHSYLLWNGDIIMTYATSGVILLLLRNWSVKRLVILSSILIVIVTGFLFIANSALGWQIYDYDYALNDEFPLTNSLMRYLQINFIMNPWSNFLKDLPITFSYALGNMAVGIILGKFNFFTNKGFNQNQLKFFIITGLIGFSSSYIFHLVVSSQLELSVNLLWIPPVIAGGMVFHSLFYLALIRFLYQSTLIKKGIKVFVYVGKTALTNYIFQSLLYLLFFYHLTNTFNLFGKLTIGETYFVAIVFFGIQSLFSYFWLKKFKRGPVEFIWRESVEMVYRKTQKRKPASP